ncbi:MAG: hypothetical protein AAFP90_16705 [Planctomycetota bacterium]
MTQNLLAVGHAWLRQQLNAVAAVEITIQDHAENPTIILEGVLATPGETDWTESEYDAVAHHTQSQDWIVDVALLHDANDNPVRPQNGWVIIDTRDNTAYAMFAMPGGRPWRYSDESKHTIRIHTQSLANEQ